MRGLGDVVDRPARHTHAERVHGIDERAADQQVLRVDERGA